MNKFLIKVVTLITTTLILNSCNIMKVNKNCISSNEKAIEVAEREWLRAYGQSIYDKKPFVAKLKDNNIWIVEGTLHTQKGGVPYAEINAKTCEIIKISHGK